MLLRLIEERDLEAVRDLRNRNREWFFDDREVTAEEQHVWFASLHSRRIAFYVIEQDGDVVGTISVAEQAGGHEVGNLTLDERYRGRGLMADALAEACHEPGTYFARVKTENEASLRVFERAGFDARYLYLERSKPA